MAVKNKSYGGDYTVSYRNFRGVDFSGDGSEISRTRFSYLENMYKDYDADGGAVTESVPGFRKIAALGKRINGIYSRVSGIGEEFIIVHAGDEIYTFALKDRDTPNAVVALSRVKDGKSHAINHADKLYLFDGEGITVIEDDGATRITNGDAEEIYVPTTFVGGKEYEQRNLLTRRFIEKNFITKVTDYGHGTPGLKYRIISEAERTAGVCATNISVESLSIPSSITLDGKTYRVIEIGDSAFRGNNQLKELTISSGVERIGRLSFSYCENLETVITPDSIKEIGNSAFCGCTKLVNFHLGASFEKFGVGCFSRCDALTDMHYSLDAISFGDIINYSEVTDKITLFFSADVLRCTLEIPIYSKATTVSSVKLGGSDIDYTPLTDENGIIRAIVVEGDNKYEIEGREIEIRGKLSESEYSKITSGSDIISTAKDDISSFDAIVGCTVSESFDGRIFLSGNSALPNTVFYTARDISGSNSPLYFGALNYFNDGIGAYTVKNILAAAGVLIVLKSGEDGGGSIFYHTPYDTGEDLVPKIYPVSYTHSGYCAKGAAISFFDDPLFISAKGVSALEKRNVNLERSIVCRSHNVNKRLLSEDLSEVKMTEWCGYLVLLAGSSIYLADSRATFVHETGGTEYEWYYLNEIGTYENDERVYRYSSIKRDGFDLSPSPGSPVDLTVFSESTEDGTVYFVKVGAMRYEVYPTEELRGGVFSPACSIFGSGNILIFGTHSGDVCIFNNDMRGVAPKRLSELDEFDEDEYRIKMGRRIHPDFYSFAGHAPRYALKSALDDGGMPHLTKNTIKHSLTLKCKSFTSSSIVCEVGTDLSGYREIASFPAGEFDFSEIDFASLSVNTQDSVTLPIAEKEKGWIEKQIALYSSSFLSPFGIYSITYRFTVKGKIKKDSR